MEAVFACNIGLALIASFIEAGVSGRAGGDAGVATEPPRGTSCQSLRVRRYNPEAGSFWSKAMPTIPSGATPCSQSWMSGW
jgi:hypothetical protein